MLTKALWMWGYGIAIIVLVKIRAHNADVGVPIALASSTNYNMGDPIVVRPQHLGSFILRSLFTAREKTLKSHGLNDHLLIAEDLVTKGIQPHERDADVSGGNPVLQFVVVVKVVGARPPVQGGEGDITAGERRDVGKFGRAKNPCLAYPLRPARRTCPRLDDRGQVRHSELVLAVGGIILPWLPILFRVGIWPPRVSSVLLVDCKCLRPWRTELQAHIGDIKGFAWKDEIL